MLSTIMIIIFYTILVSIVIISTIIVYKQKKELKSKKEELLGIQDNILFKWSQLENLKIESEQLVDKIINDKSQVDILDTRKKELNIDIAEQVENIEHLKTSYETIKKEFEKKHTEECKDWLEQQQKEYLQVQTDFVEQFKEDNKKKMAAAQELTSKLETLRSEANAAVEVAKRHAEEENFVKFHSLQMGQNTLNDIRRLEEIVPSISPEAGEAIAKVIWKVYYEKPYTDLVGRVIGSGRHTGIYQITNINTKMCYIGQAVDIADRWRQHIKRALNAEPRTQNKLYPAMYKEGIENFTFEIIEECDQSQLNKQEDYWQDFYKAKEYGYSIK